MTRAHFNHIQRYTIKGTLSNIIHNANMTKLNCYTIGPGPDTEPLSDTGPETEISEELHTGITSLQPDLGSDTEISEEIPSETDNQTETVT